jgi:hypothetical protein
MIATAYNSATSFYHPREGPHRGALLRIGERLYVLLGDHRGAPLRYCLVRVMATVGAGGRRPAGGCRSATALAQQGDGHTWKVLAPYP